MAELTCAEKLAEARTAMHLLVTGTRVVSVGYGERRIQYSQAMIAELRTYIKNLEAECGDPVAVRRPLRGIF